MEYNIKKQIYFSIAKENDSVSQNFSQYQLFHQFVNLYFDITQAFTNLFLFIKPVG